MHGKGISFVKWFGGALSNVAVYDEFASCLSIALAPARAASEQTLAPLARALLADTPMPSLSEVSHEKGELLVGDGRVQKSLPGRRGEFRLGDPYVVKEILHQGRGILSRGGGRAGLRDRAGGRHRSEDIREPLLASVTSHDRSMTMPRTNFSFTA